MDRLLDAPAWIRKALFAAFAGGLLLLGYLASTGSGDDAPDRDAGQAADTGTVITQPSASAPAPSVAAPAPETAPAPALTAPVTDAQIAQAARGAEEFAAAYASYRYDADVDAWIADLRRYLTSTSMVDLTALIPDGPAAEQARNSQSVITATGVQATGVEFLADSMVTLTVQVDTTTTTTGGSTSSRVTYEVVMVSEGDSWRVDDARLADGAFDGN